ncbi:MAG: ABC-2 family transporter protein [Pseudomonadota bacterium]
MSESIRRRGTPLGEFLSAASLATIAHCFRMGWREAWTRKTLLASLFFAYAVLIGVWASVWFMVPATALEKIGIREAEIVWYFALTELVVFAMGHLYRDVEEDIRSGQMTMFFVRPVSYVALKGAEWLGHCCLRLCVFLPGVAIVAAAITGEVPVTGRGWLSLPLLLVLGSVVGILIQVMVGLSAAWFRSARPQWMIVQKCAFVLGGMVLPITFYPDALQIVAWATPFPALLFAPASVVLDSSRDHIAGILALQICWIFVCAGALWIVKARFEQHLLLRGEL